MNSTSTNHTTVTNSPSKAKCCATFVCLNLLIILSLIIVASSLGHFDFHSFLSTLSNNDNNKDHSRQLYSTYLDSTTLSKIGNDQSLINQIDSDIAWMLDSSQSNCMVSWPNVESCAKWYESETTGYRFLLSNSIPNYFVEEYCPFEAGLGYCFVGDTNSDCDMFRDMICPAQDGREGTNGDVPVAQMYLYRMNLNPNPLDSNLPQNFISNDPLIWSYETLPILIDGSNQQDIIALHLNGVMVKSTREAEGLNVDLVGLELHNYCGGHVTPPVGLGPLYHYHKISSCIEKEPEATKHFGLKSLLESNINDNNKVNNDEYSTKAAMYAHSELQGYANDGFGVYGRFDFDLSEPILDECNGHFGATGDNYDGEVTYHYHYRETTWDGESLFTPYWVGCQGPSKLLCASVEDTEYLDTNPQCGQGCGYELCVATGTSKEELEKYFEKMGDKNWADGYTINPY